MARPSRPAAGGGAAASGWKVDFLGAHVPTAHLMNHLHRTGPHVVAVSASLPTDLPTAHAAVTAVQATSVPVIVGGAAFGPDGEYARALGADGWARDAREGAATLESGLRLCTRTTPSCS
jgi:methanogenic corrinoid protein MtbC1